MNDYLNASAMHQTDPRAAGGDQRMTSIDQREPASQAQRGHGGRGSRKCGLDTGARGWRWIVQSH